MSSAEPTLGADLYIKAVEAGIPAIARNPEYTGKDSGQPEYKPEYARLGMATKQMAVALFQKGLVKNDENKVPYRDDEAIRKLKEEDHREISDLYEGARKEHEDALPNLAAEGKAGYVTYFRDLHMAPDFSLEETTVTRVREADMQAIASASLNLLDAVHKDPANAAFVKGLDNASIHALWDVLETSNYVVPGEDPYRKAPLGEQALRGTPEEREALIFQASTLAANLELPEKLKAGDGPTASALILRNAVNGAEYEEVTVDGINASPDIFYDSDLTKEDANSLFNFVGAANRMFQVARQEGNVVYTPQHLADATHFWLDDCIEKGIDTALSSGSFEGDGMDPKFGARLGNAMKWAKEALTTDAELTNYTGDDGGALTQEGATMEEDYSRDNAFDISGDKSEARSDDEAENEQDTEAEVGDADDYLGANKMCALNESMSEIVATVCSDVLEDGVLEKLRAHAGRAATEYSDLESGAAAFGTAEEASGSNRVATTPEMSNRLSEVMSYSAWANMNPSRRDKLKVALVMPGRGVFKEYKAGSPTSSYKKMTRYLDERMLDDNGKPNLNQRNFLRDAAVRPVVADNYQAAKAVRDYATRFVSRDEEEHRGRQSKEHKPEDLTNIEFTAEQAKRMVDVAEAAGTNKPIRLSLFADGRAALSHPDAPRLESQMDKVPEELSKAKKVSREFGGQITIDQLKGAVETGAEKVVVRVFGETPVGVIGKTQQIEEPTKAKAKSAKRYGDVVLS